MPDTLDIFGKRYTGVTGIIATDSDGNEQTYTKGDVFVVTFSKNATTGSWEPDCTFSEAYSAYEAGKTVVGKTENDYNGAFITYDDDPGNFFYQIFELFDEYNGSQYYNWGTYTYAYVWSSEGIELDEDETYYSTSVANAIPSDVSNGKVFYNALGVQIGTNSGSEPNLQSKTATYTPTESQQTATITADSGYDGLSSVGITVNAVSNTYVGTGITRRSSTDLTASGATVTVPAGYYSAQASKSVATGTAGTPTATKGTVSNHSVSVTPSVTNTTGYISGGTKTGTAVTVTASELTSGSETKTANGSYDVTNLKTLVVAVPIVTYYTGSSAPASSLGSNGDIYLRTS